mmetsp:Transcript_434/g.1115  ORF Transcript_434/g.1115 Transcript_434/m.1115 type:complete len:863 (+) Transcript_434:107-2695(+)
MKIFGSMRLRDLIRAVRACKTAAEEREVIAKESAALREDFRSEDGQFYRHRNVAKLMYIHMLGYPTHFGQMETLKLIAGAGFAEKRIGYLGLMILLDERQEVLMLVTNSIKLDLNHINPYIVGLALAALGNICSAEMARDLTPDVKRRELKGCPYERKKALLCMTRIIKKVPELLDEFMGVIVDLPSVPEGAVELALVTLMLQIVETDPSQVPKLRSKIPALCKMLRRLVQGGGSSSGLEISGVCNPFLQVKILRLLRHLGRGDSTASDQMSDILAQVASNVDASRNAGNAVLYECVQTIMGVESISGLRVLAINTLGRFLANRDNNMRYVALNTLAKVVVVDTQAVQRHRITIVECVKDADVSIRRRALELVYGLVNEGNIRMLARELLDYLAVSDADFKPDLTSKICTLIQRFAPDRRWQIDSLLQVMVQAGAHVKDEVCRSFIVLITNAPGLHAYSVRSLYRSLKANLATAESSLLCCGLWCIGEFGEMLLPTAGQPLIDKEPPLRCSEKEVVDLLTAILSRKHLDLSVREHALTAAMKLTARYPSEVSRLKTLLTKHNRSPALEVQSRSTEYTTMFKMDPAVRTQLLERMPALNESEYYRNLGVEMKPIGAGANAKPAVSTQIANDLLGDLDAPESSTAPTTSKANNDLEELLGGGPSVAPASAAASAAPAASQPQQTMDILDLLGDSEPAPAPAAPSAAPAQPAASGVSPLDLDLGLGPSLNPTPAPPSTSAHSQAQTFTAYQNSRGFSVQFACTKPKGLDNGLTEILATYHTSGPGPLTDFHFQAAVPKFIQLQLQPATGTALAPNSPAPVQQRISLNNTQHGAKGLAMRLRITYKDATGQAVTDQAEVGRFPPGF